MYYVRRLWPPWTLSPWLETGTELEPTLMCLPRACELMAELSESLNDHIIFYSQSFSYFISPSGTSRQPSKSSPNTTNVTSRPTTPSRARTTLDVWPANTKPAASLILNRVSPIGLPPFVYRVEWPMRAKVTSRTDDPARTVIRTAWCRPFWPPFAWTNNLHNKNNKTPRFQI